MYNMPTLNKSYSQRSTKRRHGDRKQLIGRFIINDQKQVRKYGKSWIHFYCQIVLSENPDG